MCVSSTQVYLGGFPLCRRPPWWYARQGGWVLAVVVLLTGFVEAGDYDKPLAPSDPRVKIRCEFTPTMQVGFMALDVDSRWRRLTFSPRGGTNLTLVQIDGRDVVFGYGVPASKGGKGTDGKWVVKGKALPETGTEHPTWGRESVWKYGGVEVKQVVRLVAVAGKPNVFDTCLVSYELRNLNPKHTPKVGVRVLLDTMLADNDACAYQVSEKSPPSFEGQMFTVKQKNVPAYLKLVEVADAKKPGFYAFLSSQVGGGLKAPDWICVTQLPKVFDEWQIPVKDVRPDSALVLYWTPTELPFGQEYRLQVGFAYGLGKYKSE